MMRQRFTFRSLLAVLCVGGVLLSPSLSYAKVTLPERDLGPKLTDREAAFHVLNRMAFGPRPGDVEKVMEMGWEKWARAQLKPGSINNDEAITTATQRYPAVNMTLTQAFAEYRPPYTRDESDEERKRRNQLRNDIQNELRDAVLYMSVNSERQFEEVMCEFWRNHFNIDNSKDDVAYMAANFEAQVIRTHAFGKFENMLLASATHPAMLTYLDNVVSQRPLNEREMNLVRRFEGSDRVPATVAALARQRGLNENYARELMELHTMGVDRRYTQWDVTELARVLTGWSAGQDDEGNYGFMFRERVHDDDDKRLFNTRLKDGGFDQGVTVIRGLARHRYTAEFISYKLCRYLIRDEPSERLVDDVSRVFRKTNGNLPKVYEAIIFSPDFMYRQNHRVKFKTPFEFMISSLRALDVEMESTRNVHQMLGIMGQPIYRCEDPTGYYDQAEAWLDPGVLVYRWVLALNLGDNKMRGVRVPDRVLANVSPENIEKTLVSRLIPGQVAPETLRAIQERYQQDGVPGALSALLGSAEFQQQ